MLLKTSRLHHLGDEYKDPNGPPLFPSKMSWKRHRFPSRSDDFSTSPPPEQEAPLSTGFGLTESQASPFKSFRLKWSFQRDWTARVALFPVARKRWRNATTSKRNEQMVTYSGKLSWRAERDSLLGRIAVFLRWNRMSKNATVTYVKALRIEPTTFTQHQAVNMSPDTPAVLKKLSSRKKQQQQNKTKINHTQRSQSERVFTSTANSVKRVKSSTSSLGV